MSFLVDTNVFLEILLNQPGRAKCEEILRQNPGALAIADFSLHSIGVIALRRQQVKVFNDFRTDSLPNLELLHLDRIGYPAVARAAQVFGLDFDDASDFLISRGDSERWVRAENQ
jgi:predicted nucleic acid-binding protein